MERGAPTRDSPTFRARLEAFLQENHWGDYRKIASYLKQEAGLVVESTWLEKLNTPYYNFQKFLSEAPIVNVLTAITLIYRFLDSNYSMVVSATGQKWPHPKVTAWHQFVARVLREENLGYTLDEKCGVHYLVDEEFERNRISALRAADGPRYAAVRDAFENAHRCLDANPADTKGAIRSMFEAMEILAKLMVPGATRLTSELVKKEMTELVGNSTSEPTERQVLSKVMQGIADLVDGIHFYRHGQATKDPIAPSLPLAVHVLATGAAVLRLWLQADAQELSGG